MIFVTILLLGATVCFWTIETTELTNILTYGGREMLSYPLTIYHQMLQRFFLFVVPVAFGSYVPTCYILGRPLPFGLSSWLAFAGPLAAALFAFIAASSGVLVCIATRVQAVKECYDCIRIRRVPHDDND